MSAARGTPAQPRPLPETRCPLCGGPNGCAPAASGTFGGEPCWCRDATFSADLLARVPLALRGRACICRRCATAGAPGGAAPSGAADLAPDG